MVYYIFRFLKSKLDSETDILLLFAGTRWGSKNFEQADIARNNAELKVIYGDICADRASHDTIDTASVVRLQLEYLLEDFLLEDLYIVSAPLPCPGRPVVAVTENHEDLSWIYLTAISPPHLAHLALLLVIGPLLRRSQAFIFRKATALPIMMQLLSRWTGTDSA